LVATSLPAPGAVVGAPVLVFLCGQHCARFIVLGVLLQLLSALLAPLPRERTCAFVRTLLNGPTHLTLPLAIALDQTDRAPP
jgi:hypothetical protein